MIDNHRLNTLKGSPSVVVGSVLLRINNISSLLYCPHRIDFSFECSDTKIQTLEHGPLHVGRGYDCKDNFLETLRGCIELINGSFFCHKNLLLNLLTGPKVVKGRYVCGENSGKFTEEYVRSVCLVGGKIEI